MINTKRPAHGSAADTQRHEKRRRQCPESTAVPAANDTNQRYRQNVNLPSFARFIAPLGRSPDARQKSFPKYSVSMLANPRGAFTQWPNSTLANRLWTASEPDLASVGLPMHVYADSYNIRQDGAVVSQSLGLLPPDTATACSRATSQPTSAASVDYHYAKEKAIFLLTRGHKLIDRDTGRYVPEGSKNSMRLAAHILRQSVNPQTGRLMSPEQPGAIAWAQFAETLYFDPDTGRPVSKGTVGAEPLLESAKKIAVNPATGNPSCDCRNSRESLGEWLTAQSVDFKTCEFVPFGTPGAIALSTKISLLPMDPNTGTFAAAEALTTIPHSSWVDLLSVDPKTGLEVPAGTRGAIDLGSYKNTLFIDPQTRNLASFGTDGAMPLGLAKELQPVDPDTNRPAPADTPGAVEFASLRDSQPVHPQYGYLVPPGTPNAISFGNFKNLQLVHPHLGIPVPPGWRGGIAFVTFNSRR